MARPRISMEMAVAVVSSLAFHVAWITHDAKASHARRDEKPAEVLIEAETVVKPPPAPVKDEPKPEPTEAPKAEQPPPVVRNSAPRHQATAPEPPSPAQAGKTLTAPETDDNSSDVADFTMVQGVADSYAGGTTSSTGKSAVAVRGPVSEKGPPATTRPAVSAAPAVAGPDRSRSATPASADWDCSRLFPTDPEAGDQAAVLIAVTVLANGTPRAVSVLRDPGHGFGAAAKACALAQRYNTALDREGNPVVATTPPITVRFTR